jgi:hypothetical protein
VWQRTDTLWISIYDDLWINMHFIDRGIIKIFPSFFND